MRITLKKKRFKSSSRKGLLWTGIAAVILCILSASYAYAAEPISISHALIDYTSDGPTTTLNLSLDITNNANATLADAAISAAPIGPLADRLLELPPEQFPVFIGNIPASGKASTTYPIKFTFIVPEEEIKNFPLFWEIKYTDETGQAQFILVASQPAAGL